MNLTELFQIQKKLDERIIKEHGLEGQDLLDKKILALQVEIGELVNEWRGFKFWSKDQEPRTEVYSSEYLVLPDGREIEKVRNPLLEEYVDCLHFLLSIGNELEYDYVPKPDFFPTDLVTLFLQVNAEISDIYHFLYVVEFERDQETLLNTYQCLFDLFLMIGQRLGFTEQEAMDAYIAKNKINHARQDNSY